MKNIAKRIIRKLGIDLIRFTPEKSDVARLQYLIAYHRIDLILDVGANNGQFAKLVRELGYSGKIISYEPLSSAHSTLRSLSKRDPMWEVAPQCAIGNTEDTVEMNISANSVSSSLLKMLDSHLTAAPGSEYIGTEVVKITKLDTIARDFVDNFVKSIYLKLDVQGFELEVLKGASQILQKVKGIQMELSLIPLYEGEAVLNDMLVEIDKLGYELHALVPAFTDTKTGRLLQVDGIFFRK